MKTINGIEMQDWEVVDTTKVAKVATWVIDWVIKNENRVFDGKIQVFDSRNIMGDYMENIYFGDGIMIDYCGNGYIEVFGFTDSEYKMFIEWLKMMNVYLD